jgi:hypothetical protein
MKWLRALLVAALVAASVPALAAGQGNTVIPTTGILPGVSLVNDVNAALDAVLSCSFGPTAPSNGAGRSPDTGQCWVNNTNTALWVANRYDGASWVVEGYIDTTNHLFVPSIGGGLPPSVTASATTDIGVDPHATQIIAGNTTITSFGSTAPVGSIKVLEFTGTPTITYNATSLITPAAQNIVIPAGGGTVIVDEIAAGDWLVINTQPLGAGAYTGTGADAFGTSPNFLGTPTAPTATTGDNTTQLATDAFVNASIAATGTLLSIVEDTGDAPVTISNASPAVISWTGHGLIAGNIVTFGTTGSLPTGLTALTPYYVIAAGLTTNTFEVSATPGGSAINTSSAGSGTQNAAGVITAATGVNNNIVEITVPVGDWDCNGTASFGQGSANSVTQVGVWVSTASATYPPNNLSGGLQDIVTPTVAGTTGGQILTTGPVDVNASVPTPVYVEGFAYYTGGTNTSTFFAGSLRCRKQQ